MERVKVVRARRAAVREGVERIVEVRRGVGFLYFFLSKCVWLVVMRKGGAR